MLSYSQAGATWRWLSVDRSGGKQAQEGIVSGIEAPRLIRQSLQVHSESRKKGLSFIDRERVAQYFHNSTL